MSQTQSLNAGSELDDDLKLDLPEELPGVPDEQKDDESLLALESSIQELIDLSDDIQGTGGMSQSFALEAERILPGILSCPTNYFSKAPSQTQYRLATEEIHKGIWALIAAATAAVLAAIYKIYKWFSGDSSGDDKGAGKAAEAKAEKKVEDAEKTAEGTVAVAEGMVDAADTLRHNPVEFSGTKGHFKFNSMDHLIEQTFMSTASYGEEKKFFLEPEPVHRDIVDHGPYSQLFDRVAKGSVFTSASNLLKDKIKLLEEIIHKDRNAQGSVVAGIQKDLDLVAAPIKVKFSGETLTLRELADKLRAEREKAEGKKTSGRLHYDDMFNRINKVYKNDNVVRLLHQVRDYLPVVSDMKDALQVTQDYVGDLSHDGQAGGNSPPVAQKVRSVISILGQQITGFAALSNEIDHYVQYLKRLSSVTVGFGKEIVTRMMHLMEVNEVKEIPSSWKKVRAAIDGATKAMEASHFPSGNLRHNTGRFAR